MSEEDPQEFQFDRVFKKGQQKVFQSVREYLQHCQTINPLFIYAAILIEALQILWFSIHPFMQFLQTPTLLQYVRSAVSYLNFQHSLYVNNDLLLPFVLLTFGVTLVHIGTIVISIRMNNSKAKHKSQASIVVNKMAAYQIILFNTVLAIPIFNISVITLYCDNSSPYHPNRTCYNATYIVLCFLSGLNLLILILESLLYWFIFYLRNPFSNSYYALSNNLFRLGRLLIKFLPPLYFVIDVTQSFQNVYVFVFLILVLAFIAFFRISSIHNFCEKYFYAELFLQSVILWFCINTVICFRISSSGMNVIYTFICSLLFAFAVCSVEGLISRMFFMQNLQGNIKKPDREKFVYMLIDKLFKQNSSDQVNPIVYIKMLNLVNVNLKIQQMLIRSDLKNQEIQQLSREVMLNLIQKLLQESPLINIQMVKSEILFDCGLRILSLHQVSQLRNNKLSFYEQFMIYHFKSTHKAFEDSQVKKSEDNLSQIQTYLNFIQQMNQFQIQLQKCAINNEQYWEQLCEDMPSTNKVYNLANRNMRFTTRIQQIFKKIQTIYPQNVTSLMLYYQFLNDVCVRLKQCNKIKQKLALERQDGDKESNEFQNSQLKIKFKANETMSVIHVSTNTSSIGTILNCNSEVKKYFGFEKSELINQKVTKIMPKIYSQVHDGFIDDYLKKADATKLPVEKTVFAFKKNLKIIETCLAVKMFPNVLNGFQLVGFIKYKNLKENIANIMFNVKTLQIEGMTEAFLKMCGNKINLAQIQKQPLKISHLFPEIQSNRHFVKREQINTLFRFSDCTDRLIDVDSSSDEARRKFEKDVILQVQCLNHYDGLDIGVLNVRQDDDFISLQHPSKNKVDSRTKMLKNKAKFHKKQVRSMAEISNSEQVSIQRKIDDFITTKSNENKIFFFHLFIIVFCVGITIASILMNVINAQKNTNQEALINQLKLSINLGVLQGKIVNLNNDVVTWASNSTMWAIYKAKYLACLSTLQSDLVSLFEKANQRRGTDLVINVFTHYTFNSIFRGNNTASTTSLYYTDGMQQAIFLAKNVLTNYPIAYYVSPVSEMISETLYFVEYNMNYMLPNLAYKTQSSYKALIDQVFDIQTGIEMYFVISRNIMMTIFCIFLCICIRNFSKYKNTVLEIYNNIFKWDAYELYTKCLKFRTKSFEVASTTYTSIVDTPKTADLFKVFPKSLLVLLSQGILNRGPGDAKTSILAGPNVINKSGHYNEAKQQEQKLCKKQSEKNSNLDLATPNKADLIYLNSEDKMKMRYIGVFLVLFGIITVNVIFLFLNQMFKRDFLDERNKLMTFGSFSSTFLYTYFYGVRSLQGTTLYDDLYSVKLDQFYTVTKKMLLLIDDDKQTYIRDVYKNIELLNSMVKQQVTLNSTAQQQLLLIMQTALFQIVDKIQVMSIEIIDQQLQTVFSQKNTMRLIRLGFDISMMVLFYNFIQRYLVGTVSKLISHSSNMVRMVPIWVVKKSKKIKDIMCGKEPVDKTEPPKKKNLNQSSTMLVSNAQ